MKTVNVEDRFKDGLTKQEVFDLCAYHLGTMDHISAVIDPEDGEAECRYRMEDGNSCAVGYFLKDDEYTRDVEYRRMSEVFAEKYVPRLKDNAVLLGSLQRVHDRPGNWNDNRHAMLRNLESLASMYDLDVSILSNPDLVWNKSSHVE